MYSESDINAAVEAGALSREAAAALRDTTARSRAAPAVDEESFRLLTGFNDIFVAIAAALLLAAIGWLASPLGGMLAAAPPPFEGSAFEGEAYWVAVGRSVSARLFTASLAVAVASWALAEYFTRRRRMALPSILLLASFVLGVGMAIGGLGGYVAPGAGPAARSFVQAAAGLGAALAAYSHWRRFHVPITIAALTGALVVMLVSLVMGVVPASRAAWLGVMLVAGIGVFGFAMWWDMSDRERRTRRADVAFWLHLAAAPMIAHPVFNLLGVLGEEVSAATAVAVLLLYLLFGFVALAVDRRALLVSGLVYVLYALAGLFRQFGAVSLNVALTALVIGSALLLLSAFWHPICRRVLATLPPALADRLPVLDRPAPIPRPA